MCKRILSNFISSELINIIILCHLKTFIDLTVFLFYNLIHYVKKECVLNRRINTKNSLSVFYTSTISLKFTYNLQFPFGSETNE